MGSLVTKAPALLAARSSLSNCVLSDDSSSFRARSVVLSASERRAPERTKLRWTRSTRWRASASSPARAACTASTRAKSLASRWIASSCAASFGARRSSIAWIASLVLAEVIEKKTRLARRKSCPLRSIAAIVLSNVGAAASPAIAAISASCARIPSSMAGS